MTFVVILRQDGITAPIRVARSPHGVATVTAEPPCEVDGPPAMRERRVLDYPVPPHPVRAEGVAGRRTRPLFLAVQLRLWSDLNRSPN
jgi:hypothetical protein